MALEHQAALDAFLEAALQAAVVAVAKAAAALARGDNITARVSQV